MNRIKNYKWTLIALCFFLLIQTEYLWGIWLSEFYILFIGFLLFVFVCLIVVFVFQFYRAIKSKFRVPHYLWNSVVILIVVSLTLYKPYGLIDNDHIVDRMHGKDLLIAGREGSAGCQVSFKLKEDGTFIETAFCFGPRRVSGKYKINRDTIIFDDIEQGRGEEPYFQFAVVEEEYQSFGPSLIFYKNSQDSVGYPLFIHFSTMECCLVK